MQKGYDNPGQFADALKGIAKPLGRHTDVFRHNDGDTYSISTSWTSSLTQAIVKAQYDGVVLKARIPNARLVRSPDRYMEAEVLVTGVVSGADVKWVLRPGFKR